MDDRPEITFGVATEEDFLGIGWSFPPTFSRLDASVVMVSGDRNIQESLWVLFSTSLGERLMLPRYGSQLSNQVFQAVNTTFITQIEEIVRQAIVNWEPRIDVDEVIALPDATVDGLVTITVNYTVRRTNARSNLVYPFYLQEGNVAAAAP